jgi:hypothetical protein
MHRHAGEGAGVGDRCLDGPQDDDMRMLAMYTNFENYMY